MNRKTKHKCPSLLNYVCLIVFGTRRKDNLYNTNEERNFRGRRANGAGTVVKKRGRSSKRENGALPDITLLHRGIFSPFKKKNDLKREHLKATEKVTFSKFREVQWLHTLRAFYEKPTHSRLKTKQRFRSLHRGHCKREQAYLFQCPL